MVYYSETANGCIPAEWKDDGTYNDETWPADAILLTEEEESIYWKQTPPPGKILGVLDGRPGWVDVPPPSDAQILATQSAKLQAATQISAAQKASLSERISQIEDAVEFGDATAAEISELPSRQSQLSSWKRYSTLLGRVTSQPGWHTVVVWPPQPEEGFNFQSSLAINP